MGFRESLHRGTPSATHLMGPGNVGGGQPWPERGAQAIKCPAGPGWAQETAGAQWDPFSSQANTSRPQVCLSCLGFPMAPCTPHTPARLCPPLGLAHPVPSAQRAPPQLTSSGLWADVTTSRGPSLTTSLLLLPPSQNWIFYQLTPLPRHQWERAPRRVSTAPTALLRPCPHPNSPPAGRSSAAPGPGPPAAAGRGIPAAVGSAAARRAAAAGRGAGRRGPAGTGRARAAAPRPAPSAPLRARGP